jgi:hypothetical protein
MSSGFASFGPALLAAAIAGAAAWLSWRKLQLDLFEKRYTTYRAISDQTLARMREIGAAKPGEMPKDDELRLFWAAGHQVAFLFNPIAQEAYGVLDKALQELAVATVEARNTDPGPARLAASQKLVATYTCVLPKLEAFRTACTPALRQYSHFWYVTGVRLSELYAVLRSWKGKVTTKIRSDRRASS